MFTIISIEMMNNFTHYILYHLDCCASINTDESIELSSPCLGESVQPIRFSLTYTPNNDTYNGRNVYESTTGGEYVFYSSSIEVR